MKQASGDTKQRSGDDKGCSHRYIKAWGADERFGVCMHCKRAFVNVNGTWLYRWPRGRAVYQKNEDSSR